MGAGATLMRPLHFERLHEEEWKALETALDEIDRPRSRSLAPGGISGVNIATLYRRACDHLALARARSYPVYITNRLERMTSRAHQAIYYRRELGFHRAGRFFAHDFPRAVQAHRAYLAIAAATFLLPTFVIGLLVYWRPELILSVVNSDTAASFEEMYSPAARSLGRLRTASTDWMMFGHYIRNNIGVSFQCFAGGLFAGIGSLFFLAFNGAFGGAVAGYLTARGLSSTFYSFIATHSSFELTAIVISGAAGLRIGHAILAPGRLTRTQSLVTASRDTVVLLYGVIAMLLVAAAVEAFWSSAQWLPPAAKYTAAAVCWFAVFAYFTLQGRRAG
jgi:uncharacterized membrane protein SpoIIM required for sporulation